MHRANIVAAAVAAALASAVAAGPAAAGPHSGVDAQLYRPSFDPNGLLSLESARSLKQYDFSLKIDIGFAQDPFRLPVPGIGTATDDTDTDSVLKFALTFDIAVAFALTDRFTLGLDVGLVRTSPDDGYGERGRYRATGSQASTGLISLRPLTNIDPTSAVIDDGRSVPTDARVGAKYRLLGGDRFALALLAIASVPFGDEEMFLGDSDFVFEPRIAAEGALGKARIVANAGARFRRRTVLEAYNARPEAMESATDAVPVFDLGSELVGGLGVVYALVPQLIVSAEATVFAPLPASASWGTCTLANGERCSTLEDTDYFAGAEYGDLAALALLGLDYRITPDTALRVAGGTGRLFEQGRGEEFRVMGGVVWAPSPEGSKVIGRGDVDGDDIPDRVDICPDDAEDRDTYQDDDGCPDLDNDGDGVIDARDRCVDEPEDRDGHDDDDGCPERDNDGDRVPDVTDRCPGDREDADNFEDDDGCPDEDNDGDGIADAKDRCPNEPETVNGYEDTDGCADEAASGGPQWALDSIDLRGARVEFAGPRSAALKSGSKAILDDIAKLFADKPEARVRIEVHTALGTTATNPRRVEAQQRKDAALAQRRADVVRQYLLGKGVDVARIQTVGIGSARPLVQPPSDPANERIDFIRTEQQR
jgi:outer membrane protein OmpA-like peptidoglycan-associated protein